MAEIPAHAASIFRLAVDLSPTGMIMVDDEGRIVLVNREFERLFGYDRDELIGNRVEMLVPESARATHSGDRSAFSKAPAARPMGAGRELFGRRKDGTAVAVEIGLNPVEDDGRRYVLASVVDISARRGAEQRFHAAFESSPHGMIMTDAGGTIVLVNREVERLFGYERAELIGRPVEVLVPDRFRGAHPRLRDGFMADPHTRAMGEGRELFGRRKDGSELPVEIGLNPVTTDSGTYVLSSIIDVTHRRQLESQLLQAQKMEAIGTLAGGIAHDFNNILGAIVGYAELVRAEANTTGAGHADLDQLLAAAERGKHLVKRILAFSRQRPDDRTTIDLQAPVSEALQMLRATLPTTIDLRQRFEPDTPRVLADSTQIHQVIMNLATNAAHALAERGGRMEIVLSPVMVDTTLTRIYPEIKPGLHARLRIVDNGAGIAPEILNRVLEPFFTTKPAGHGSGMGLAVVHGIVRSHGGTLGIRSMPDVGTTIDVYLPAAATSGEAAIPDDVRAETPRGQGQHVLLVDDDPVLTQLGRRALEHLGYRVTATTSSPAALERVQQAPAAYDVVLTDYTMPELTGTALARAIHDVRENLPVVLMSGYTEGIDQEMLRDSGISEVIGKPVTTETLAAVLHRTLHATS